jgi:hypothetical protein
LVDDAHLAHIKTNFKGFADLIGSDSQVLMLQPITTEKPERVNTLDFYHFNQVIMRILKGWIEENSLSGKVHIRKTSFVIYAIFDNRDDALLFKLSLGTTKLN